MVKPFKRVLMGAILFTGINVMAGGFDAENTDDASESRFDDAGHRIIRYHLFRDCVESYIQAAAKEKGIKKPVKLASLAYTVAGINGSVALSGTIGNNENFHKITVSMSLLFPSQILGIIHHELGHVVSCEKNLSLWNARQQKMNECIELEDKADIECNEQKYGEAQQKRKKIHEQYVLEEQFADAAVPDSKVMLKGMRSLHRRHEAQMLAINECAKDVASSQVDHEYTWEQETLRKKMVKFLREKVQSFKTNIKLFVLTKKELDTFSKPMDEAKARELDERNFIWHDEHPSSYRRAYYFDDRIKALEAKERSVSIEKGAAFNDHVEQLTTSDLLS